ncbi:hypothetical protein ACFRKB_21110 [Streptomyces scopuliridis]|uniref:hypothetical protein n=1 Tax=Streptomyces scopuliridis TaxID=452529 RepID=UPI0036A90F1A
MDYGTRLERAVSELESRGDIEVERRPASQDLTPERSTLPTDADLAPERVNALCRTQLGESVGPYLFAANEYHANWVTADDRVRGEFCLRNLYRCLTQRHLPLTDELLATAERRVLPELKIFDQAPFCGAGQVTGLRASPAADGAEIWHYVSTRTELHHLHLDYGTYLETLLITKGAWGWQYLFADVDLTDSRFHDPAENLAAMFDTFPVLFPDHDYEPLYARWRERL